MSRMSGNDSVNRNVLSRVRMVARDGSNVTSSGRQFHTWGPATENARRGAVNLSNKSTKKLYWPFYGAWKESLNNITYDKKEKKELNKNHKPRKKYDHCKTIENTV